jgi:hypothetical protein
MSPADVGLVKGYMESHHISPHEAEAYAVKHAAAKHESVRHELEEGASALHRMELRDHPMGLLHTVNPPRPGCPYGNCGPILGPHDVCGMTFYIACNMMLAFTLFFFV